MLTLKTLREDPELVIRKLAKKHFDAREIVADVIAMDDRRKAIQQESDALLGQQKKAAAEIGALMKAGKKEEAEAAKAEVAALKARSQELLQEADSNAAALQDKLVLRPIPTPQPSRTNLSSFLTFPVTLYRKVQAQRITWL